MKTFRLEHLTPAERTEYMRLQMSPRGGRSGLLPDDRATCGACGEPIVAWGWCPDCAQRYQELRNKLNGRPA